jgi:hypothetical protein
MVETLDISQFQDVYTEQSLADEATRPDTIRKGNYNGKVVSVELRPASDKSPFPGRPMFNYRVGLEVDGKIVTKFVEVSPSPYRVATVGGERVLHSPEGLDYSKEYPLDGPAKLWGQLSKLVNPTGTKSVATVVQDSIDSTFSFFVSEPFIDEDKKYHSYKSEEERAALVKMGLTPKNYINSISKAKG